MNPKYNRIKGKNGELEIAELFTKLSGVKYRRVPLSGGIHEFNPSDLMKVENKESVFDGINIEVKNTKSIQMPQWLEQIRVACADSNLQKWILCFKHKGKWNFVLNENLFKEKFNDLIQIPIKGVLDTKTEKISYFSPVDNSK